MKYTNKRLLYHFNPEMTRQDSIKYRGNSREVRPHCNILAKRASQQSMKAAEEWFFMEDDQEVVEAIGLDYLGEAADD